MFSRIRSRFTYANVAVTIALVFAMSGGAYAAGRYVITSTKQISPKVLKALKGASGKNGAPGAAGAQGPAGPAGAAGAKGETGAKGELGTTGGSGESVTGRAFVGQKGTCKEGGAEFTVAGKATYACNGSPWPAGGTLPEGATETGEFALAQFEKEGEFVSVGIAFGIPLAAALPSANVHTIGVEEGEGEPFEAAAIKKGECKGNSHENQGAASGDLCVFVHETHELEAKVAIEHYGSNIFDTQSGGLGAGVAGAFMRFSTTKELGELAEPHRLTAFGS